MGRIFRMLIALFAVAEAIAWTVFRACPKGGKGPKIRHGSALAGAVNGEAVRVLG